MNWSLGERLRERLFLLVVHGTFSEQAAHTEPLAR
jgi:hypothetical protein